MTNELVQELRRASELFSDDGWWKPETLSEAADEIDQLRSKIASARALLEPLAEHDPAIREWLK